MSKRLATTVLAVILVFIMLSPALAKEPATPSLSLNDAINLALSNSESIVKAKKEVERTKTLRDYEFDEMDYQPMGPQGSPATEVAMSNLMSSDLTWRMSKKTMTAEEDSVVLSVCQKYWDVQKKNGAVISAEATLKQAEIDLKKALASHKVGLISNEELLGAETKLASARSTLEKARNDLDSAYSSLNQLIGLWSIDRPVLTEDVIYTPVDVKDLDTEVNRVLATSPSIWLATEKINMQKYLEELMFYSGKYKPADARRIESEQAELDALSAEESVDLLTRSLYYTIKSSEDSYPAAEQAVKLSEERLRLAKIKFAIGVATQSDIVDAEVSLVQSKQVLLELKQNHAYLKLAFQKPWAYAK